MKRIILFFALLCIGTSMAQMQKLHELSAGAFIDSAVIMEEDESDVYGYCLLYEIDRKSKEVYELEYILLDKNLNKLTTISLTQGVFKTWLTKSSPEITFVKKIGNQLTIAVNDRVKNIDESPMPFYNYRFVNVNLTDFSFTKEYKYEAFTKKESNYKPGDKTSFDDIWDLQKLVKTKSNYLLSFAAPEYNPKVAITGSMIKFFFKQQQSVKRFAILDKDLNIIWSKDINQDKKTACGYSYLDSDGDVLLLKKQTLFNKEILETKSLEVYDIKTGNLLGEITIEDKEYDINLYSVSIVKDHIHIFTNTYQKSKAGKYLGYGHLVFDKLKLNEIKRDFILWKNLSEVVPGVNEFGMIKKDVVIAQDFVITPKGTTVMVVEAYSSKTGGYGNSKLFADLKDMYIIEFNADNSVAFSNKIEKKNTVQIPFGLTSYELRNYGAFDYIFCQKINGEGDFVMYYTLNDQVGTTRQVTKKPLLTLGIVSDIGGEFGFDTLPLYGGDIKIYPGIAKNGYIRLLEVNQKTGEAEMRLEKINY